ncbi:uncharacterized protein LOC110685289 [Chenopodium quinoa]|uniref:uncharacterized protein LOC110685289 n=1 Tax=Chenopodium quinoa TaxID=63459 RepID=UPI000B774998|nr:uncharacterized protein LOC110685289 [Chenopodium quinoa]
MSALWLLVRSPGGSFDVRVDDTDKTNLMELFEYMFEDSVKQNVFLPKYFTLFVSKPRTNRKLELVDDGAMLKMWEWNEGKDEIEVLIEETENPSVVFKSAEASWARTLKMRADKIRQKEEERRRNAEAEEVEEELNAQEPFTVAVEVPVVNAEEDKTEYVRIFHTAAADESFPGDSQPQPSQNEPSQPSNEKKLKPKEWRVPRSTTKKYGVEVVKNKRGGREVNTRSKKPVQVEDSDGESDPWPSEDSEDDDYEFSEAEDDLDMELNLDDEYIVEEEDLADNIQEKTFEDYLDGTHVLDKLYKNGKVWSNLPFGSIQLEPWLIFETKEQFHDVFRDFCIQEGFAVTVDYADNHRYTARCLINDCSWRIHAAVLVDKVSWAIKILEGEHKTCGRMEENPMVSSAWLCRHLRPDLKANPDIPVNALQRMCLERFRIQVKSRLFYKVKCLAMEQIHGGFAQSYALLPKYAEMIKATNPGSYALITWTDSGGNGEKFKACFISFAAPVKGFLGGCKPIIEIDGAHLSGYYKGVMLTAVSIDGNNEIFVIAYGLVDTESIDSWTYFFRNLRILFAQYGSERDDWTFISDRMRGVESALFEVFPRETRRVCCQHVYSNCKKAGWSGTEFHKLFWIATNAYNAYVYDKAMSKIKKYDAAAFDYLTATEEQWSRYMFDKTVCCDHNTTNFVESFNSCTKDNRDLPVLTLMEAVRNWCMKRMGSRFDKAIDMDPNELTEFAKGVLETRSEESRLCHVTAADGGEFKVRDGHVKFPVTLQTMTCGCGKWQDYVSPYFKGAAYKLTYGDHIHPMSDPSHWPAFDVPEIAPPTVKRAVGRPAKQRRRASHEARKGKRHKNNKCSLCKELRHNAKTCKARKEATKQAENAASSSHQGKGRGRKRKADS